MFSRNTLLFACLLAAGIVLWAGAAQAGTIDKTTSFTGSANDLVGNGGNYGPDNLLRFGPSVSSQTFIINAGTLTDGTHTTATKSMDILGTSNIVTFTGGSTQVIITNSRNWGSGGSTNGSFHLECVLKP